MCSASHDQEPGYVCPWWLIWTFDNPARRLFQNPEKLLRDFVREGDRCLDVGCGTGYFTIPMARLAGKSGSVTAVDLQARMLEGVRRRAEKAGLQSRIRLHRANASNLDVDGVFDFALAFWMVHEVPDQSAFFRQIGERLRPSGRLLVVEPSGHVDGPSFDESLTRASRAGLERVGKIDVAFSRAALLERAVGTTE